MTARACGANAAAAISSRWTRTSTPGGRRRRPSPARIARRSVGDSETNLGLGHQQLPGAPGEHQRARRRGGARSNRRNRGLRRSRERGGYSEVRFSGARFSLCAALLAASVCFCWLLESIAVRREERETGSGGEVRERQQRLAEERGERE